MVSVAATVFMSAVALACGRWALVERKRTFRERARTSERLRQTNMDLRFRDALILALAGSVIVLTRQKGELLSFHGGSRLLKLCLAGPDASGLASAIDRLLTRGEMFSVQARTGSKHKFVIHGRPIGDRAVVYFQSGEKPSTRALSAPAAIASAVSNSADDDADMRASYRHDLLQTNRGVIVVGPDGYLRRFNRAFAEYWSLPERALSNHPHLDDIASLCARKEGNEVVWETISSAICAAEPEGYGEWGAQTSVTEKRLWLAFERLSDGNTLVIFHEDHRAHMSAAA